MAKDSTPVETAETAEVKEEKAPRVPKQLVWNTKSIREVGGSLVFAGKLEPGKQLTYIGQFQGKGHTLDKAIAEALGVEHAELAKKLGQKTVISMTVDGNQCFVSKAPHTEDVA